MVCTPTNTHYEVILEAASAGKHIFCEKPVDLSLDRIRRINEHVEKSRVQLMVGFNRRFDPSFGKLHEIVQSGRIGTPEILRITSRDPRVHPAIRFNYLSTEQDRREWVEAIRVARNILNQPAMDEFNGGEVSPGPAVATDEEILAWVGRDAETALHPSCTARMGVDPASVVDPLTMRVHGLEGLRVVDASVMPYVTNGNIYAPVMMVAEKAADLILGNTPLPPAEVDFYRHRRSA